MARRGCITAAVTIRDYRDSDELALSGLLRELQTAELKFNARLKPAGEIGEWYIERLRQQCGALAGAILLAMNGSSCLGCAVVLTKVEEKGDGEELPFTYAHVSELIVTIEARGRGIGKALLKECERRSRAAGRDEMTIAVYAANESALNLYRSCGFADTKVRLRKTLA